MWVLGVIAVPLGSIGLLVVRFLSILACLRLCRFSCMLIGVMCLLCIVSMCV